MYACKYHKFKQCNRCDGCIFLLEIIESCQGNSANFTMFSWNSMTDLSVKVEGLIFRFGEEKTLA